MNKKTALVFGATGGIGRAITRKLFEKNYQVCAVFCHTNEEEFTNKFDHENLILQQMDLTSEDSVRAGFVSILDQLEYVDTVIFSVSAPIENKQINRLEWNDFKTHLDVQVKGLFHVVRNLDEQIKSKRGIRFVVLLTEACIGKPPSGMPHYVTAKYALMGLAKSMAVELAKYNCTVNMVSPGMVETDLISHFPKKLIEMTAESNPLKRIATPEDVAQAVMFFVDEDSSYINGVNIPVNGGGVMF